MLHSPVPALAVLLGSAAGGAGVGFGPVGELPFPLPAPTPLPLPAPELPVGGTCLQNNAGPGKYMCMHGYYIIYIHIIFTYNTHTYIYIRILNHRTSLSLQNAYIFDIYMQNIYVVCISC